ncbi:MAG: ABC transporter permease, partial [Terriglobales bacterium]
MANGSRSAWRQTLGSLQRRAGLSLIILLTLALGLGANIAIFSVVDGILFQPLPFPSPSRLVTAKNGFFPAAYFAGLRQRSQSIAWAAYSGAGGVTLVLNGQPVELQGSSVSANLLSVLGVAPELGPGFRPGDDQPGQDGVAVLSNALWRSRFAARADVIGRVVRIGGQPRRIVGVMPAGFQFPSSAAQVWLPYPIDPANQQTYWSNYSLQLVGRLRHNASLAAAAAEMQGIAPAATAAFPYPISGNWATSYPTIPLREALVGNLRLRFLLLLGAVGLVLLIACVNVANLLLSQVTGRRRELAVRMALGASRWRVLRQLVGETLLLSLVGGALGVVLAAWGGPVLVSLLPHDTPQLAAATLHWRAFGFALASALGVGLITGLLPGWRAGQGAIEPMLRGEGGGAGSPPARQRLSATLLVFEVAIAVVVIVAGTLLAASLIKLSRLNPGFDPAGVTTLRIAPSDAFCANYGRCTAFYQDLQARVAALPGVSSAALVNAAPLDGGAPIAPVVFDGHPLLPGAPVPLVWANVVTPDYLRTLDIHLLAGRDFTASDSASAQKVVLINAALARDLWPRENPIGKQVTTLNTLQLVPWTVAGVVADVREMQLSGDPTFFRGEVYFPYAQALASSPVQGSLAPMTLLLRSSRPPSNAALHA